jgi:hypothetical protein
MPAHEEEAEEAEREGVTINWLRTITAFDGPELTVEAMELDETGFPRPTGRMETLAADSTAWCCSTGSCSPTSTRRR